VCLILQSKWNGPIGLIGTVMWIVERDGRPENECAKINHITLIPSAKLHVKAKTMKNRNATKAAVLMVRTPDCFLI
jgi:hypothetical protein